VNDDDTIAYFFGYLSKKTKGDSINDDGGGDRFSQPQSW